MSNCNSLIYFCMEAHCGLQPQSGYLFQFDCKLETLQHFTQRQSFHTKMETAPFTGPILHLLFWLLQQDKPVASGSFYFSFYLIQKTAMALSSIHPSIFEPLFPCGFTGQVLEPIPGRQDPPQVILGLYRTVGAQFATFYATSVFLYSFRVKKGSGSLREYSNSRKSEPLDHVDFEIRP